MAYLKERQTEDLILGQIFLRMILTILIPTTGFPTPPKAGYVQWSRHGQLQKIGEKRCVIRRAAKARKLRFNLFARLLEEALKSDIRELTKRQVYKESQTLEEHYQNVDRSRQLIAKTDSLCSSVYTAFLLGSVRSF